MTYSETLGFLYSALPMYQRIGAAAYKADLNNTLALCKFLGNPENKLKTIHIAGTNGKGSTSHMLASIFQEAGYKTGLYTSPHLRDFRERIKINGKWIEEQDVIDFVDRVKLLVEEISPSFFELTVGMAFDYFVSKQVDIAIIETGMGGRLDSTNVITPQLSIITNIGYDHMQFLGDTLPKIAFEKAGIIKENIPVLIGEKHPETFGVFENKATELKSRLYYAGDTFEMASFENLSDKLRVDLVSKNGNILKLSANSPLTGLYQLKNIRTVAAAVSILNENNYPGLINFFSLGVENVIINTGLEGRWQKLGSKPDIYCDTGHNEDGIKEVLKMLEMQQYRQLWMIIGMVNDKDVSKVLKMLPGHARYVFTKADIPRALPAEELVLRGRENGLEGLFYPTVANAIEFVQNNARADDFVFIGGSTFVVADALQYLIK